MKIIVSAAIFMMFMMFVFFFHYDMRTPAKAVKKRPVAVLYCEHGHPIKIFVEIK